jgi:hypothetical protein
MKRVVMVAVLAAMAITARAEEPTPMQLARAEPSPALLRLLADEAERGQTVLPILQLLTQPGGAVASMDVAATRQERGHFRRNWGWYAFGTVLMGATIAVGEHNDWGGSSGNREPAQPTIRTENNGQQVSVNSGDNSPVTITITAMPPE